MKSFLDCYTAARAGIIKEEDDVTNEHLAREIAHVLSGVESEVGDEVATSLLSCCSLLISGLR